MNGTLNRTIGGRSLPVTCEATEQSLIEYIFDELSDEQKGLLERHIDACPNCKRKLTLTWAAISAVGSGGADGLS